eukprot:6965599-Ditylum_brightwellii.AAC.1
MARKVAMIQTRRQRQEVTLTRKQTGQRRLQTIAVCQTTATSGKTMRTIPAQKNIKGHTPMTFGNATT